MRCNVTGLSLPGTWWTQLGLRSRGLVVEAARTHHRFTKGSFQDVQACLSLVDAAHRAAFEDARARSGWRCTPWAPVSVQISAQDLGSQLDAGGL